MWELRWEGGLTPSLQCLPLQTSRHGAHVGITEPKSRTGLFRSGALHHWVVRILRFFSSPTVSITSFFPGFRLKLLIPPTMPYAATRVFIAPKQNLKKKKQKQKQKLIFSSSSLTSLTSFCAQGFYRIYFLANQAVQCLSLATDTFNRG